MQFTTGQLQFKLCDYKIAIVWSPVISSLVIWSLLPSWSWPPVLFLVLLPPLPSPLPAVSPALESLLLFPALALPLGSLLESPRVAASELLVLALELPQVPALELLSPPASAPQSPPVLALEPLSSPASSLQSPPSLSSLPRPAAPGLCCRGRR